jgi:hypothetical protein
MKIYLHTFNIRKDGTQDSFLTQCLKHKEVNSKFFVLFNSRWHRVKEWNVYVDNNTIRKTFYIGPFSTYLQNTIQFETERNFQKNNP